ncbi:hypothetical protein [Rhodovulum sp. MB263]|uniref:hypothetical protein n=1 Tax=Rhodovulum sp. (strain MB263) TaxID=308754 RepID=UPI0009B786FB|nr:hypothetical protein [Rhodovulum sp. MB263]ARC88968.1 hypothetical protein B5V46_10250 [Rhodovulum sp. MB263]
MTPFTLACDWTMDDDAAVQKAFRTTARKLRLKVADIRGIVTSMEPRSAWAEGSDGRLQFRKGADGPS